MRKIFNKGFFIIFVFLIIGLIPSKIATESSRIQGKDRYETSVQVSKKSFTSSQYAVIASGENFDAPVLLFDEPTAGLDSPSSRSESVV